MSSKYIAIAVFLVIIVFGGIFAYQYWLLPKKFNCASSNLPGYKVVNEFFVDLNNDKQKELARVYVQKFKGECPGELPIIVKIFSGNSPCYKEKFTYPAKLSPINADLNDKRYNLANGQLMKNFWGDGRDVIFVLGTLNFCGSGSRNQLLFFSYHDGKYIKIDGPVFSEIGFYFLSSHPEGRAILVAQGKLGKGEAHFDPHRYTFLLYKWNGQKYEEIEIGTTKNKYDINDSNFKKIKTIFENEPEKLRSEIEKL